MPRGATVPRPDAAPPTLLPLAPLTPHAHVVRGRVSAEVGAVLLRALEASEDALFRARGQHLTAVPAASAGTNPDGSPVELSAEAAAALDPLPCIEPMDEPRQRRADALGLSTPGRKYGGIHAPLHHAMRRRSSSQ